MIFKNFGDALLWYIVSENPLSEQHRYSDVYKELCNSKSLSKLGIKKCTKKYLDNTPFYHARKINQNISFDKKWMSVAPLKGAFDYANNWVDDLNEIAILPVNPGKIKVAYKIQDLLPILESWLETNSFHFDTQFYRLENRIKSEKEHIILFDEYPLPLIK